MSELPAGSDRPEREVARRGLFETYRRQGRTIWLQVSGRSMGPLLRDGDWVQVAFGATPGRRGELVLFDGGGRLVVHRAVARRDSGHLLTKGDGTLRFDPPLDPGRALGVVIARRRGATGRAATFGCVGTPARAIALLSLLAGVVAARVPGRPGGAYTAE